MPSLNLRLEHWQLEALRVDARLAGRSMQRQIELMLFPPAVHVDSTGPTERPVTADSTDSTEGTKRADSTPGRE